MKLTDCKLSQTSFTIRGLPVISCEFNTPRIKRDVVNMVGETISFMEQLYTIVGVETYAIPEDCEIYGCSFLVENNK